MSASRGTLAFFAGSLIKMIQPSGQERGILSTIYRYTIYQKLIRSSIQPQEWGADTRTGQLDHDSCKTKLLTILFAKSWTCNQKNWGSIL
jgi:hypothetical protein